MRTLHFGLRVADLDRALTFYAALGYGIVGSVPDTPVGHLTMLKLPGDDFVTIELVHDPSRDIERAAGLSHFVVQVASMRTAVAELTTKGIEAEEPSSPDGSDELLTSWVVDPDGNRIELVQWPPGHADGMTSADFTD
ncbi:MAG: VOC family protein [Acidimicrobiales bacterium]